MEVWEHDEQQSQLAARGRAEDHVELAYREPRWPSESTKAERRARRAISINLGIAILLGLAAVVIFLFWPADVTQPNTMSTYFTPLLGVSLGGCVLFISIAAAQVTKTLMPEEIAVQTRSELRSPAVEVETTLATVREGLESTGMTTSRKTRRFFLAALGVFTAGLSVAGLGGFIKNPWSAREKAPLWHTGWSPIYSSVEGEIVYLRSDTGDPYKVKLVRPEDLDAGGMMTVFPWRKSDGVGDTEESRERLLGSLRGIRNAVMLVRFRPEETARAVKRKGQESFNYGDYWAYTKVCSHLGCPASLYEQQTHRFLCPCHQSQFDALHYGKAVFGPAARALSQLPIGVTEDGYLAANGDFREPVGPAFWEANYG